MSEAPPVAPALWHRPQAALAPASSQRFDDQDFYEGESGRFLAVAILASSVFLCAGAWNTLAAVFVVAEERFDVGPGAVNWVSLSTFITYVPGTFAALWAIDRFGLRVTILCGMASQLLMNVIKTSAVASPLLSPHGAYWVMMVGQIIGGAGQPLILNVITRFTMDWFPNDERDIATTAVYQAAAVGSIFFSLLPPVMITQPSQVASIMWLQLVLWAAVAALAFFLLEERPANSPSAAAAMQWAAREKEQLDSKDKHQDRNSLALQSMGRDFRSLSGNANYMALVAAFCLIQGLSYVFPTLVGQFLEPCGYSAVVAGNASALLAGAGIVGCLVVAPLMQATKRYRILQVVVLLGAGVGAFLVLANNRPDNLPGVYMSWAALGLLQGPLGPLTFEHGAEITYPTSPENAASFLSLAVNLWGFVAIAALTPLLQMRVSAECASPWTPAAAVVLACVVVAVACVFLVREDNRRAAAEAKWESEEPIREVRRSMDVERMDRWEKRLSMDVERRKSRMSTEATLERRPLLRSFGSGISGTSAESSSVATAPAGAGGGRLSGTAGGYQQGATGGGGGGGGSAAIMRGGSGFQQPPVWHTLDEGWEPQEEQ